MVQRSHTVVAILCFGVPGFLLLFPFITSSPRRHVQIPVPMANTINRNAETRIEWSPSMDVVDEDIALKGEPNKDLKKLPDVNNSIIYIIDQKPSYRVEDEIRIFIQLHDGYGKRRTVGGDNFLVRMFEDSLGARSSGYILDHMNGCYTAVVSCLWAGNPSISVVLDFPREAIRVLYNYFATKGNYLKLYVTYRDNDRQLCDPYREWLNPTKGICDMTDINGGMSWFCQAPKSNKTSCTDVKIFTGSWDRKDTMLEAKERRVFPKMQINVKGEANEQNQTDTKPPPCFSYNKTQLWFQPSPVGFFMHDQWKIKHCSTISPDRFPVCLKYKHLIFYGDSTIRQWYLDVLERFKVHTDQKLDYNWKVDMAGYSEQLNLTVEWVGHSFPGNRNRPFSNSISQHMLKYIDRKNMVFVIHIFVHIITHPQSVWRDRIRHIRQSIELFLKLNKNAKFLIKGGNGVCPPRFFRYAYYPYRVILMEEFKGLYDKVIYLDNADATIASGRTDIHPNAKYVTGMVDQMLAYICD